MKKSFVLLGPVADGLVRIASSSGDDVWEKGTIRKASKDSATGEPLAAGSEVYRFGTKRISAELVEATANGEEILR